MMCCSSLIVGPEAHNALVPNMGEQHQFKNPFSRKLMDAQMTESKQLLKEQAQRDQRMVPEEEES